jgi:hypothetical protein
LRCSGFCRRSARFHRSDCGGAPSKLRLGGLRGAPSKLRSTPCHPERSVLPRSRRTCFCFSPGAPSKLRSTPCHPERSVLPRSRRTCFCFSPGAPVPGWRSLTFGNLGNHKLQRRTTELFPDPCSLSFPAGPARKQRLPFRSRIA